jgi:transposase
MGRWLTDKRARLSFNKAAVALANKNARIIWSLLNTGEEFNCNVPLAAA